MLNTRANWVSVDCSCQLDKRQKLVPIRYALNARAILGKRQTIVPIR